MKRIYLIYATLNKWYSRTLIKDTIVSSIGTIIGGLFSFAVPVLIAVWFGLSSETDAFFLAYGVTLFFVNVFSVVVENVIVPSTSKLIETDFANLGSFLVRVMVVSTISTVTITVLFLISWYYYIYTFYSGNLDRELLFEIAMWTSPLLFLVTWSGLAKGVLLAHKLFWIPSVSPAFRGLTIIAIAFAGKNRWGIISVAIGYLVGETVRLLVFVVALARISWESKSIQGDLPTSQVLAFMGSSIYLVIAMVVTGVNPLVDKFMALSLPSGTVSILEYGYRIYSIPLMLLTGGLSAVLLSHWSRDFYSDGRISILRQRVMTTAIRVGIIGFVGSLAIFALRRWIVKLIYSGSSLSEADIIMIAQVFGAYILGLSGNLSALILVRGLLVLRQTQIIMFAAVSGLVLNVSLNLILIPYFGAPGIAIATSLVQLAICLYLARKTQKITGETSYASII